MKKVKKAALQSTNNILYERWADEQFILKLGPLDREGNDYYVCLQGDEIAAWLLDKSLSIGTQQKNGQIFPDQRLPFKSLCRTPYGFMWVNFNETKAI
jgi:hypothetical protein